MVTFLITSLFIVVFLAVALYFWQKPTATSESRSPLLPPPEHRGLFEETAQNAALLQLEESREVELAAILERASSGEKSALLDAGASGKSGLYDHALSLLVTVAQGPQLLSLVSYVCRNDLPVSTQLAEKFIESWKKTPDRNSTAEMLHIAALSDNAQTYRVAVDEAVKCWLNGNLSAVSADELKAIIDGEFWVLSSQTRSSGAGFLLKEALRNARRELEAARNPNSALLN